MYRLSNSDYEKDYPLHAAILSNQAKAARLLENPEIKLDVWDSSGTTPLHLAVCTGAVDLLKKMLAKKPAYINIVDKSGRSLLHEAVNNGQLQIIKYLISLGFDVNRSDIFGLSALTQMVTNLLVNLPIFFFNQKNIYTIICLLRKAGADTKPAMFWITTMLAMAHVQNLNLLEVVCDNLMQFVQAGAYKIIKRIMPPEYKNRDLLVLDSSSDSKLQEDKNSINNVSHNKKKKRIRKQEKEKIKKQQETEKADKELLTYLSNGNYPQAKNILKSAVSKIREVDNRGFSALFYAVYIESSDEQFEIIELLLQKNIDIGALDAEGKNVFHHAAAIGNKPLLICLLRYEDALYEIIVRDKHGNTAYDYALSRHAECAALLQQYMEMICEEEKDYVLEAAVQKAQMQMEEKRPMVLATKNLTSAAQKVAPKQERPPVTLEQKFQRFFKNFKDNFLSDEKIAELTAPFNEIEKLLKDKIAVHKEASIYYATILYNVYRKMHKFKMGEKLLSELIESNPSNPYIMCQFGYLETRRGNLESAEIILNNALSLLADKSGRWAQTTKKLIFYCLTTLCQLKGNYSDIKPYFDAILNIDPNDIRALVMRAHWHMQNDNLSQAAKEFHRLYKKYPQDRHVLIQYAWFLFKAKKYEKALREFTNENLLGRDACQAKYGEGRVYFVFGEYQFALECFNSVIQNFSTFMQGKLYYWITYSRINPKDTEKIIDEFTRLSQEFSDPRVFIELVKYFSRSKNPDSEIVYCMKAIELKKDHVGAHLQLIYTYLKQNKMTEAINHCKMLCEDRSSSNAKYYLLYIKILLAGGDIPKATQIRELFINKFSSESPLMLEIDALFEERNISFKETQQLVEQMDNLSIENDTLEMPKPMLVQAVPSSENSVNLSEVEQKSIASIKPVIGLPLCNLLTPQLQKYFGLIRQDLRGFTCAVYGAYVYSQIFENVAADTIRNISCVTNAPGEFLEAQFNAQPCHFDGHAVYKIFDEGKNYYFHVIKDFSNDASGLQTAISVIHFSFRALMVFEVGIVQDIPGIGLSDIHQRVLRLIVKDPTLENIISYLQNHPVLVLRAMEYAARHSFVLEKNIAAAINIVTSRIKEPTNLIKHEKYYLQKIQLNNEYKKCFLNGVAKLFFENLICYGVIETLFPSILEKNPQNIAMRYGWATQQFDRLDRQFKLTGKVSFLKVQAILIAKEITALDQVQLIMDRYHLVVDDNKLTELFAEVIDLLSHRVLMPAAPTLGVFGIFPARGSAEAINTSGVANQTGNNLTYTSVAKNTS